MKQAEVPVARGGGSRCVVLVGMMGSGKTLVGRSLSARLGVPFVDADARIESVAGESVSAIFANRGESGFRALEEDVMADLLSGEAVVIAGGGGAFLSARTRAAIKRESVSVWLRASLETLARRVGKRRTRPLLPGGGAGSDASVREVLARLLAARTEIYGEADVVIDVDKLSAEQAARQIAAELEALPVREGA